MIRRINPLQRLFVNLDGIDPSYPKNLYFYGLVKRIRALILPLLLLCFVSGKAQTNLPLPVANFSQRIYFPGEYHTADPNPRSGKWQFGSYTTFSTGMLFYPGGAATFFSVPVGLQLTRKINNHVYAFAAASVGAAYINSNPLYMGSGVNKNYPMNNLFTPNGLALYSRAELGLTYMNDDKTFSISGSIGIERSSYPVYQSSPANTGRQIVTAPRQ